MSETNQTREWQPAPTAGYWIAAKEDGTVRAFHVIRRASGLLQGVSDNAMSSVGLLMTRGFNRWLEVPELAGVMREMGANN